MLTPKVTNMKSSSKKIDKLLAKQSIYSMLLVFFTGVMLLFLGQNKSIFKIVKNDNKIYMFYQNKIIAQTSNSNLAGLENNVLISIKQTKASFLFNYFRNPINVNISESDQNNHPITSNFDITTNNNSSFFSVFQDRDRYTSATRAIDKGVVFSNQIKLLSNNYSLTIRGSNITEIHIDDSQYSVFLRPIWHLDGHLIIGDQEINIPLQSNFIFLSQTMMQKVGLNMILASIVYFFCLFLIIFYTFIANKIFKQVTINKFNKFVNLLRNISILKLILVIIALLSFLLTLYTSMIILESFPHSQDEVSYIFQAKNFQAGQLYGRSLPTPLNSFFEHEFIINQDKWYGIFPPGWSALLAAGITINIEKIINPMLGLTILLTLYIFAKTITNRRTSFFLIASTALSPFFIIQNSSYLSHTLTCLLYLLFFLSLHHKKLLWSGIMLGLTLLTRPYNAILVALMGFSYLLIFQGYKEITTNWKKFLLILPGFIICGVLFLLYNKLLTGNLLITPQLQYFPGNTVGFGKRGSEWLMDFTPIMGYKNVTINFHSLLDTLSASPYWASIFPIFFLFLPTKHNRFRKVIIFLWISIIIQIVGYALYHYHGVLFGPRYWFEVFLFIMMLISLGFDKLCETLSQIFNKSSWISDILIVAFTIILFVTATINLPKIIESQKGENAMVKPILSQKLTDKSIILIDDSNRSWQAYGKYLVFQSPKLDGKIIYARNNGLDNVGKNKVPIPNTSLQSFFPEYKLYLLDPITFKLNVQ